MPRVSRWLFALAVLSLPLHLPAQELARTFCDDADPANNCPGEDCVCSDDTLEVVFNQDLSGSVHEYDAFPAGGLRVSTLVAASVRTSGIRGWEFSIAHDEAALSLSTSDLVLAGTAGEPALAGGFVARRVVPGGYLTAIILSFVEPVVLPVERVSLIRATYTLVEDVGAEGTRLRPDFVSFVIGEGVSRRPRRVVDGLIRRRGVAPERFRRGDADGSGRINIADGLAILQSVFGAPANPACADALDANDDGQVAPADALPPLRYVFGMGPPLAPPFEACGSDPTPDALGCVEARCTGP